MLNGQQGLRITLVLGAAVLAARVSAYASDWPQYKRDSARTGSAPEEVLKFPMQRVVAVRFPAPIYASPAVVGGKVYVQDARGHVACVESRSNKVLWTTKIAGVTNMSSPAVSGGRVFVGSSAGYLAILDAVTGQLIKKVPSKGGVITAPAVEKKNIYFSTTDAQLVKIDRDGKIIWSFQGGLASYVEFAVRNGQILFFAGKKKRGGALLYRLVDEGQTVRLIDTLALRTPTSGPVFGDGTQYAVQCYDTEWGLFQVWNRDKLRFHKGMMDSRGTPSCRKDRYYRGDACFSANGKPIWMVDKSVLYDGGFHSSPALGQKHLAVGSEVGKVFFLPLGVELIAKRGRRSHVQKPVWSFETLGAGQPDGAVSSSPAIADGMVVFGGEDGILYGLGSGPKVKVVNALPKSAYGPRVRLGTKLSGYEWHTVGGDMSYSCVSPDTKIKPPFRIKWKTRVWGSAKGPMIVAAGKVFRAARMGGLAALDAETGEIIWRTHHPNMESRPSTTYAEGKLLVLRSAVNQYKRLNPGPYGLWCHDPETGKKLWHHPIKFGYHFNADGLAVHKGKVLAVWNGGGGALEAVTYALKDGREVWKQRYEGLLDSKSKALLRFSAVVGDDRFYLGVSPTASPFGKKGKDSSASQVTLALVPDTGKLLWKNSEHTIFGRSRIAFRKGILVVFGEKGGYALAPKTGKHLWTGVGRAVPSGLSASYETKRLYMKNYYLQPLTNAYLKSQGQRGIFESHACAYQVYVNGVCYGHSGTSSFKLVGRVELSPEELKAKKRRKASGPPSKNQERAREVWRHSFTSRSCPPPSPAYGRLYYSPNGEGVVYCFEPVSATEGVH